MALSATLAAALSGAPATRVRHVSPTGDDTGPGTRERPWRTIEHAAQAAQPGDTVLLHAGTYRPVAPIGIRTGGAPGAWTSFAAAPGEEPVVDASAIRPANLREASDRGAIEIVGPSYVRLIGLDVRDSYQFGILVRGPSHHVDVVDCKVSRTFAPGIGAWNAEHLRIVGCEVTGANSQRMRLYGDARRECPHEAISIAGVRRFEAAWNHVHHCEKEGIDVKEVSAHGVVHHNYVHDMPRQGLYADAWFGLLEDVEFTSNVVHDCEWGAVLSVEGRSSEMRNVRVHHNLLYRNRASGVYFGTWGADGPRSKIEITNNSLYRNGRTGHWAGATGNIDVRSRSVRDLLIARNVCADGGAFEIATFVDLTKDPEAMRSLGIRIEDNVIGSRKDLTDAPSPYGRVYAAAGERTVVVAEPFVDPAHGILRVRPGAAAVRTKARGGVGALPGRATRLPAVPSPLKDFPPCRPRPAGFPEAIGR